MSRCMPFTYFCRLNWGWMVELKCWREKVKIEVINLIKLWENLNQTVLKNTFIILFSSTFSRVLFVDATHLEYDLPPRKECDTNGTQGYHWFLNIGIWTITDNVFCHFSRMFPLFYTKAIFITNLPNMQSFEHFIMKMYRYIKTLSTKYTTFILYSTMNIKKVHHIDIC